MAKTHKKSMNIDQKISFSPKIKEALQHKVSLVKRLALSGVVMFSVLTSRAQAIKGSEEEISAKVLDILDKNRDALEKCLDEVLGERLFTTQDVQAESQKLWRTMDRHIDNVQAEIKRAKAKGYRNNAVKKIFDRVYPGGNVSGRSNYCVAGAMYVHRLCQDPIMNEILPSARVSASAYGGHPTVSCNALLKYFKKNLGSRYAGKGDRNFNTVIKNLKPGDIIVVSSRRNTSSGKHCLTVSGYVRNGKVPTRGFNNESNSEVSVSKILGAANIMDEYCYRLERFYAQSKSKASANLVQIEQAKVTKPKKNVVQKPQPVNETVVATAKPLSSPSKPAETVMYYEPLPAFLTRDREY